MERNKKSFEEYLGKCITELGYPGVSVSIRGPEGVLFEKGFGYIDEEKKKPADENTIYGIASMSKSMTALACAILHTEGKLSLDDSITKYFPDFHIPGNPDECVTLKVIAEHRAGIPPIPPLEWSIAMNSIERDSVWYRHMIKTAPNKMDNINQIADYITEGSYKTIGAPGEYMSYSNEGYALLSYVVDKAAGITLEEFLDKRVFNPLGMSRTVLDLDGSEAAEIASDGNMTSLFEADEETGELICDDNWSVLPPFRGCACVKSTAADMAKYYRMLADHGRFEGKQIVPEEAVELMTGKSYPASEKPYYCLGLSKRIVDGRTVCEHSGGLHGVSSHGGFVEGGYSAVVLCNQGDVDVEPLQWICYNYIMGLPYEKKHYWSRPSGNDFSMKEALEGDFLAEEGLPSHTVVRVEDGRIFARYGDTDVELLYDKGTVFVAVEKDNPERRVTTMEFFIRDGKAWAVRCYTRVYMKVNS